MKRYRVEDFYKAIDSFAPFSLAMDFDNPGLLIGSPQSEVRGALLALDATDAVVEEAEQLGADLIVAHHPLIFHPLKRVEGDSVVYRMIQKGIALISAHTNLDIAQGGVNDVLAARLGLRSLRALEVTASEPLRKLVVFVPEAEAALVREAMHRAGAGRQGNYTQVSYSVTGEGRFTPGQDANPALGRAGEPELVPEQRIEMLVQPGLVEAVVAAMREAHPYEEPAFDIYRTESHVIRESVGRVGELPEPMEPQDFARLVKERLEAGGVRWVPGREPVRRVAVCGGSGAEYLDLARQLGAQALVTGEAKHNNLLEAAHMGITFVDGGHHCTEAVVMPVLRDRLAGLLPDAKITLSRTGTDPARYL